MLKKNRNQFWWDGRRVSCGVTAYASDLLTLRAGIEYDRDISTLCIRIVALGVTLWLDVYFDPTVYDELDGLFKPAPKDEP